MNWKKSEKDFQEWKVVFNKAVSEFPGGILDWWAFSLLLTIIFIPIVLLTINLDIDISNSRTEFTILLTSIAGFVYYWIFFKNLNWLKERINK